MGNRNKNKKQQTGGLQPKGGIQPKNTGLVDAVLAEGQVYDPNELSENVALNKKLDKKMEKARAEEEKRKAKEEKAKKKAEKRANRRGPIRILRETFSELKKVRWPALGRVMKATGVVLSIVLIFGVVVFAIDFGLAELFKLLTDATKPTP